MGSHLAPSLRSAKFEEMLAGCLFGLKANLACSGLTFLQGLSCDLVRPQGSEFPPLPSHRGSTERHGAQLTIWASGLLHWNLGSADTSCATFETFPDLPVP